MSDTAPSARERLVAKVTFHSERYEADFLAELDAYRAEVLAEEARTPLIARRFDTSIEPDRESGETEMLVCAVAEDGRPVALLLDSEARAKLAALLGLTEGKGTGSGEPTPAPWRAGRERLDWLLSIIVRERGQWTVGRVKRLYARHCEGHVLRSTIRRELALLHAAGDLVMHDGSDRRYYTLAPGGAR
ncbi:hypothetical protein OOK31_25350 [Streptomyces sp. NBC_00249]|uniref:hypothetical protein n=1 Tax=Streptomyces sp. NBC_00249 TaxID=2975690 RepID=UPI002254690D|nr:hypothetical protein [Streptomyces sp. NBC_00249]MCX5197183.1 hypothetical protein [Streptomyces sp. NBC_00249]